MEVKLYQTPDTTTLCTLHCFSFPSFLIIYGQSIGLQCLRFYAQLDADFPRCQFELHLQQKNNLVNVQDITLMMLQINAWSEFIKITLQNCHMLTQFGDTVTPMVRLLYFEE